MSFKELLLLMSEKMGSRSRLLPTLPNIGLALTSVMGLLKRDIVLTRDEVDGLMSNLLVSDAPPKGTTRFADWLNENAASLGRNYQSELARNFRI